MDVPWLIRTSPSQYNFYFTNCGTADLQGDEDNVSDFCHIKPLLINMYNIVHISKLRVVGHSATVEHGDTKL